MNIHTGKDERTYNADSLTSGSFAEVDFIFNRQKVVFLLLKCLHTVKNTELIVACYYCNVIHISCTGFPTKQLF